MQMSGFLLQEGEKAIPRILILGHRKAGKTLLWRQAKATLGTGLPAAEELYAAHKATIAYALFFLGKVCESLVEDHVLDDALAEAVNNIIQRKQKFWMAYRCAHATFSDEPLVVSDDLREAVTLAWSSEAVREYTVQRMQYEGWSTGANVYQHFSTLSAEDYEPSAYDYVTARTCARGVLSATITVEGYPCEDDGSHQIIDLENLVGESRKWLHMFESVPLLFVVALDTYNVTTDEISSPESLLHEAAMEFGRKISHRCFVDSAITLVLTKMDLFERALATTPLNAVESFKDYQGHNMHEAAEYIANHFMNLVPNHKRAHTQCLTVNALDGDAIQRILKRHCAFTDEVVGTVAARGSPRMAKLLRCNSFEF